MENHHSKNILVLGIAPSSYGFGFALMEGENALANWGAKKVRGKNKNAKCLSYISDFISLYQPSVIVVEDTQAKGSRRGSRIQTLIKKIAALAEGEHVKVKRFSRKQVKLGILSNDRRTKHDVALQLAERFPKDLGPHVPPKRRTWDNDDYRMDIFDAVALAIVSFRNRKQE